MSQLSATSLRLGEPPVVTPRAEEDQIAELVTHLVTLTGAARSEVSVVRSPLRICPLGAHIDHQLGVVTGTTINRSILLAFVPTEDGSVHVESLNFAQPTHFRLDAVPAYAKGDWANYARGAVSALLARHPMRRGLVGVVGGAMPIGGLSSSAAVTTAYLLALEAVNGLTVDASENVEHCRFTENRYIGLNNGILDQSVILHSAHHHLTLIDCDSVRVEQVATELTPAQLVDQFAVLVVYSGLTHALVGTDYNNRVSECRMAAGALLSLAGLPVPEDVRLRRVAPELFERYGDRLDAPLARRAQHYFGEMVRVEQGVAAWQRGDLAAMGELVSASGDSSIRWYECGSPQLVTLYQILRDAPGVYGTRFSGAGFRGNCIALIDPAHGEAIAEAVHRRYPAAHPEVAAQYSIHFCQTDGHAALLSRDLVQ